MGLWTSTRCMVWSLIVVRMAIKRNSPEIHTDKYHYIILFMIYTFVNNILFYIFKWEGIYTRYPVYYLRSQNLPSSKSKNDNIHKNESDDHTNIDNYIVAGNIKEYYIISKLIFLGIIIPKFTEKRQLFHEKNVCKNVKNQQVSIDVWTFCSQLSSCCSFYIGPNCIRNHHTKFEIDRTIIGHT